SDGCNEGQFAISCKFHLTTGNGHRTKRSLCVNRSPPPQDVVFHFGRWSALNCIDVAEEDYFVIALPFCGHDISHIVYVRPVPSKRGKASIEVGTRLVFFIACTGYGNQIEE